MFIYFKLSQYSCLFCYAMCGRGIQHSTYVNLVYLFCLYTLNLSQYSCLFCYAMCGRGIQHSTYVHLVYLFCLYTLHYHNILVFFVTQCVAEGFSIEPMCIPVFFNVYILYIITIFLFFCYAMCGRGIQHSTYVHLVYFILFIYFKLSQYSCLFCYAMCGRGIQHRTYVHSSLF